MIRIDESHRMSAYMPVTSDKQVQDLQIDEASSTNRSFSTLEPPPYTVDNGVKTTDVLSRSGNSTSPSEQVSVTVGQEQRIRFLEKIFNLTMAEIEELKPLQNGVSFVSGLDLVTVEAPESTPENPIMYVATAPCNSENMTLTWHKVYINQVNPRSATREEMFALITYENRDSEQALLKATYAWRDIDPSGVSDGRIDFMKELQYSFALSERACKSGDMRAKEAYDALMDMIDKLGKRSDYHTKPSQTTVYHKLATERVKMEVREIV